LAPGFGLAVLAVARRFAAARGIAARRELLGASELVVARGQRAGVQPHRAAVRELDVVQLNPQHPLVVGVNGARFANPSVTIVDLRPSRRASSGERFG
jgi:hypothetical protein